MYIGEKAVIVFGGSEREGTNTGAFSDSRSDSSSGGSSMRR